MMQPLAITGAVQDPRAMRIRQSSSGCNRGDYRPVHDFTLTDDIQYIKPKKPGLLNSPAAKV